jgi:hypothetical protein
MRYKYFILFIIVLGFNSAAQDYYYYEGRRIDLTQRPEKIAVILNQSNQEKYYTLCNQRRSRFEYIRTASISTIRYV